MRTKVSGLCLNLHFLSASRRRNTILDWRDLAPSQPSNRSTAGSIEPGEKVKVLRIRYGKDFMTIKVEKENGSVGWITADNKIEINVRKPPVQ